MKGTIPLGDFYAVFEIFGENLSAGMNTLTLTGHKFSSDGEPIRLAVLRLDSLDTAPFVTICDTSFDPHDIIVTGFVAPVSCSVPLIPTLGEWGIILLSLIFMIFGVVAIRRMDQGLSKYSHSVI